MGKDRHRGRVRSGLPAVEAHPERAVRAKGRRAGGGGGLPGEGPPEAKGWSARGRGTTQLSGGRGLRRGTARNHIAAVVCCRDWFGRALRFLPLEHDQHQLLFLVGGELLGAIRGLAAILETDLQLIALDLVDAVESLVLTRDVKLLR